MDTKLKRVIDSRGLKLRWLANKFGIHEVCMNRYVHGVHRPRPLMQSKMARFFDIKRDVLFPPDKTKAPEGFVRIV